MDINGYTVRLLVNGRKVKEYRHEGRTFVEAKLNSEYEVEIKNHTPNKTLAIISVDGLDVIKGKPATTESSGYIVNGNDSIVIKGFRKDSDTVGAFKFTDSEKSYSSEMGYSGNQGVVSVRFIEERKVRQLLTEDNIIPICNNPLNVIPDGTSNTPESKSDIVSYCSNTNSSDLYDIGTTWGRAKHDKSENVDFNRGNVICDANIYYASRNSLENMGISFKRTSQVSIPHGFTDYAMPPKDWNNI